MMHDITDSIQSNLMALYLELPAGGAGVVRGQMVTINYRMLVCVACC